MYIHKTTAVWLLQEGERVSSDRLFRVHAKQPFSTDSKPNVPVPIIADIPTVCNTVEISNLCVFKCSETNWKIGRVLRFAFIWKKQKVHNSLELLLWMIRKWGCFAVGIHHLIVPQESFHWWYKQSYL